MVLALCAAHPVLSAIGREPTAQKWKDRKQILRDLVYIVQRLSSARGKIINFARLHFSATCRTCFLRRRYVVMDSINNRQSVHSKMSQDHYQ